MLVTRSCGGDVLLSVVFWDASFSSSNGERGGEEAGVGAGDERFWRVVWARLAGKGGRLAAGESANNWLEVA